MVYTRLHTRLNASRHVPFVLVRGEAVTISMQKKKIDMWLGVWLRGAGAGCFGPLLALLCLIPLWHWVAAGSSRKAEILAVGVNMDNSKSLRLQRTIEVPETTDALTVCLHLRILFLRTNPSLIFFLQDSPCSLSVRNNKLQALVGSLLLTHRRPLETHAWHHLCLVVGQHLELAMQGNYTADVDVKLSGDSEQLLPQGNATLWLGRSKNTPRGVQESVGGYATLPQVYPGRLSEEKIVSLARCEEIPDGDLATEAWRVTGQGGELLGDVDPSNLTRLAHVHTLSGVTFELARDVCPPHPEGQLLLLPGHHTPRQAARRCRSLGGQLPQPKETLRGVVSTMPCAQGDAAVACWVGADDDYYLLEITEGKISHQSVRGAMNVNASSGLCCQVSQRPIIEMRVENLNYKSSRFAIVPSETQLRFVSDNGDMIYLREDQLDVQMFGSWAWSLTFNGHWTGRHEVVNTSPWRQGPGRQVVMSACGKDEFTCTDGYCVGLDSRCDGLDDCGDKADERYCETLPERPEKHSLDGLQRSDPAVSLTFNLVTLKEIEETPPALTMRLRLQSTWHDDSLSLWHLSHHPRDNVIPILKAPRTPSYNLGNSDYESFLQRHNPAHKVVTLTAKKLRDGVPGVHDLHEGYKYNAGKEAVLMMTEEFQTTVTCFFEYEFYPFDTQTCDFNLSLITSSDWRPYFNIGDTMAVSSPQFTHTFTMQPLHQQCSHDLPARPSSINFREYRTMCFYLALRLAFRDRIMVTLSCFIVLATLNAQDQVSGVRHSSFKVMDVYMFYTLFRLFLVFIAHIFIERLRGWLERVVQDKQAEGEAERGQNLNNPSKISEVWLTEVEDVKTHQEGEIHRRHNSRDENKLGKPPGGWVHEVTTEACPSFRGTWSSHVSEEQRLNAATSSTSQSVIHHFNKICSGLSHPAHTEERDKREAAAGMNV
ncbi:hypothetical protein O3P69_002186 [Scylla paramamosain]|uniref:Uncharacterized protein n=1 Tax=Scylla paramamosain TaxID=85552 RepID=A0AAW0V7G8_SCYPA